MFGSPEKQGIDEVALKTLHEPLAFDCPKTAQEAKRLVKEPVHLLPCKIHYTGPANVLSYFRPEALPPNAPSSNSGVTTSRMTDDSKGNLSRASGPVVYQSAFRGRQVTGHKVVFPSDVVGVVLSDEGGRHQTQYSTGRRGNNASGNEGEGDERGEVERIIFSDAKSVNAGGVFTSMHVWNKDDKKNDHVFVERIFTEFMPLSEALHAED